MQQQHCHGESLESAYVLVNIESNLLISPDCLGLHVLAYLTNSSDASILRSADMVCLAAISRANILVLPGQLDASVHYSTRVA